MGIKVKVKRQKGKGKREKAKVKREKAKGGKSQWAVAGCSVAGTHCVPCDPDNYGASVSSVVKKVAGLIPVVLYNVKMRRKGMIVKNK